MSMAKRFTAARVRDAAPLFAGLGDPTRLGLGALLSAGEGGTPGGIRTHDPGIRNDRLYARK